MMLKSSILIVNNAFRSNYNVSLNPVCVQCVRWRKGRWHPIAKSKLFRIPERKKQDAEEQAELMRLHNNYKTQIRSLREYLREEARINSETSTADKVIITPEAEADDFQKCMEENDRWNGEIAQIRNRRIENEMAAKREYILQRLQLKDEREQLTAEKADELVRLEKERSKTFITREKLDEAIEHALANPVDFNFAIDVNGNIFHGRDTNTLIQSSSDAALNALAS